MTNVTTSLYSANAALQGDTICLPPKAESCLLQLQTGQLHTYLAAIPVISSAWGCSLVYCTSLQELAVMDVMRKSAQMRITIPTEPAFLALGPGHLAVGMNNKVRITQALNSCCVVGQVPSRWVSGIEGMLC